LAFGPPDSERADEKPRSVALRAAAAKTIRRRLGIRSWIDRANAAK
jgi:hypothetical protein